MAKQVTKPQEAQESQTAADKAAPFNLKHKIDRAFLHESVMMEGSEEKTISKERIHSIKDIWLTEGYEAVIVFAGKRKEPYVIPFTNVKVAWLA